ncbi:hypothetical protein BGZ98_003901 [Dissophora globulifera]|nr:hypothetical protein BGZ98_003901 [Dissophora globulifera]
MPDSSRVHSQWDRLPTETALGVCRFLPALDLLNVCVAYPTIEQLVMNTRSLWQFVHLPFPDPLLHNYPGWRRCSSVPAIPDDSNPLDDLQYTFVSGAGSTSGSNSRLAIFQDDRFRSLSEPNYFDLPDIEGGEQDDRDDNTAWILLDVLDRIPLRHIRHLSFENPPCHLCVYPCKRTCHCECHQNEHGDHAHRHQQRQCHYSAEYANNGGNNANAGPLGYIERDPHRPLSPPLQDLLDSGLVDFNQHINLRKLNEALATENARGLQGYSTGISNLSYGSFDSITRH